MGLFGKGLFPSLGGWGGWDTPASLASKGRFTAGWYYGQLDGYDYTIRRAVGSVLANEPTKGARLAPRRGEILSALGMDRFASGAFDSPEAARAAAREIAEAVRVTPGFAKALWAMEKGATDRSRSARRERKMKPLKIALKVAAVAAPLISSLVRRRSGVEVLDDVNEGLAVAIRARPAPTRAGIEAVVRKDNPDAPDWAVEHVVQQRLAESRPVATGPRWYERAASFLRARAEAAPIVGVPGAMAQRRAAYGWRPSSATVAYRPGGYRPAATPPLPQWMMQRRYGYSVPPAPAAPWQRRGFMFPYSPVPPAPAAPWQRRGFMFPYSPVRVGGGAWF